VLAEASRFGELPRVGASWNLFTEKSLWFDGVKSSFRRDAEINRRDGGATRNSAAPPLFRHLAHFQSRPVVTGTCFLPWLKRRFCPESKVKDIAAPKYSHCEHYE